VQESSGRSQFAGFSVQFRRHRLTTDDRRLTTDDRRPTADD